MVDKGSRTKKRQPKALKDWGGVVLAAGKGTRMKSRVPKVLHQVCGKAMMLYPVEALKSAGIERTVVVVSPQTQKAVQDLLGMSAEYSLQQKPLGTGNALQQVVSLLKGQVEHLLVMYADCPLVESFTLTNLASLHLSTEADVTLLTASANNDTDMGRVVRDRDGRISAVVESLEMKESINGASEVNAGVYCFRVSWLWENLDRLVPSSTGERYLTSLIALAASQGATMEGFQISNIEETLGVNDRLQLAQAERALRQRIRSHWMLQGVTMLDPASTLIDATAEIGQDTVIYPNTLVLGQSKIGAQCILGPGTVIQDSIIGPHCKVVASMLEGAVLEEEVDMGPFSHLRPGAYLERGVHVGNFCEIKDSRLGRGVAMGHFSYIGNASIGANVNLGAGTITCNYDGITKHRTVVEEDASIGSDTMLVAPVTVGKGAVTGAGSVVTKDVPPYRLAVGVPAKIKRKKRTPDHS